MVPLVEPRYRYVASTYLLYLPLLRKHPRCGVISVITAFTPLSIFTSLPPCFAASQKANNISATPFFASIEESGPEPDDKRARQSQARLTAVGMAIGQQRELKQVDRL
jgi:hypothetical protein